MYTEIVGTLLASLGGASLIVGAFAHFLGKIWTDRIAKTTAAKFDAEMESLKSKNKLALEAFKTESNLLLKEKENFAGISLAFYQRFFEKRVETYLELLKVKNEYISEMEEEFITDIHEGWGEIYHSTYISLRKLITERQIYISNELDDLFWKFRAEASEYIKEADLAEAYAHGDNREPPWENHQVLAAYDNFARETAEYMKSVMAQISSDVSKLRSRIELDKA